MTTTHHELSAFANESAGRKRSDHARIHARERSLTDAEYVGRGITSRFMSGLALIETVALSAVRLMGDKIVPPRTDNSPFMTPDQLLESYPVVTQTVDADVDRAA